MTEVREAGAVGVKSGLVGLVIALVATATLWSVGLSVNEQNKAWQTEIRNLEVKTYTNIISV